VEVNSFFYSNHITISSPESNQPMDPAGETGKLCTWVHNVELNDIPLSVRERAKHLILDGVTCDLVGAHLPWSEKVANVIFEMEAQGDAGVFGWNKVR